MELYERLLYLHEAPARIAAGFAEYMKHNAEADRAKIPAALAAITQARNNYQFDAEELEREHLDRVSPLEDFGGTPTPAQLETWRALANKETEEERQRIKEIIAALDALFREICRALDAEGLTLTGGQISALRRAGLPDALAKELEAIKREHLATIPKAERLDNKKATALYKELTRQGFISGPYTAFFYFLGQITEEKTKTAKRGLKWMGNKAEFAYFVRRFSQYTQPGGFGFIVREKALCRAFGFDDRQRGNTIRPYLSDRHEPKRSADIEAAFAALEASIDNPT